MDPKIFKEYDIRAVIGTELGLDEAERIGKGLGTYALSNGWKSFVIGRDNRLTSNELSENLISGIAGTGCDVTDLGEAPTPLVYFAMRELKNDLGVIVTASHNSREYNGFKIESRAGMISSERLQALRKIIEAGNFEAGNGRVRKKSQDREYLKYLKGLCEARGKCEKELKIVVDGSNSITGNFMVELLESLGREVFPLHCEPDGNFPNHLPDPTKHENLADIKKEVLAQKAGLGLAPDGDGDRVTAVDEKGNAILGEDIARIFVNNFSPAQKNEKVVADLLCTRALDDLIIQKGAVPVMNRVGRTHIRDRAIRENAILAVEISSHLFFRENHFVDDGFYAGAKLAGIVSGSGKNLSALLPKNRYFTSPSIRLKCRDKPKVMSGLAHKFKSEGKKVIEIDGIRVETPNYWFVLRPSNTEELISCRFEADSRAHYDELRQMLSGELSRFPEMLESIS